MTEAIGLIEVLGNAHTPGASCNPSTFRKALELALARVLRLALHVVIVVVAAPGADEKGRREEGRRADTELLDLGDRFGEGGGVVEDLLVEAKQGCESKPAVRNRSSEWRGCRSIELERLEEGEGNIHRLSGCHRGGGGRAVVNGGALRDLEASTR